MTTVPSPTTRPERPTVTETQPTDQDMTEREADAQALEAYRDQLATAEADVERLKRESASRMEQVNGWFARAEVAERQVQAVRDLADEFDLPRESGGGDFGPYYAEQVRAALAPLDPDAPTGHDGQGGPDTHQGDTEAGDGR